MIPPLDVKVMVREQLIHDHLSTRATVEDIPDNMESIDS